MMQWQRIRNLVLYASYSACSVENLFFMPSARVQSTRGDSKCFLTAFPSTHSKSLSCFCAIQKPYPK